MLDVTQHELELRASRETSRPSTHPGLAQADAGDEALKALQQRQTELPARPVARERPGP